MHTTSGRRVYGLFLALLTALLWGILPIKLKQVLQVMDPVTVTWYRLLVSGGLLSAWLAANRRLPSFGKLGRKGKGLVAVAVLGLMGNYVLYLIGLKLLSPGTAQLVVQIGPVLLLVASVFVFRERFSVGQGVGLLVLLAGFGLFFNQRLEELLTSLGTYTTGVLTILLATSIWVFYALSQKQLLTVWHSQQVMMVIYLSCAALLTPWVHPLEALQLTPVQGWLLLACCLNTLVAYGAFAEALAHWEASRVSATLALTPLVTFVAVALAALVDELLLAHAARIEGARLQVRQRVPATLRLLCDPFLMRQALANLLDNALDFTPEGGTLLFDLERDGERVALSLFNQGQAIPAYAIGRVSERFYSLPRPGSGRKSTGLGLNFVAEVMQLHGGALAVDNVDGGVRVRLWLPVRRIS